jgi:hypothetical protein
VAITSGLCKGPPKPSSHPAEIIRDPKLAGMGVGEGHVVPRTIKAPSQEPTERIPKSAAYLEIADGYIKSFAAETQQLKERRLAAERRDAEISGPGESAAPRPAPSNLNRSSRIWVDGFIPPRAGPIARPRRVVSPGRSQTEDDDGADNSDPASKEDET